MYLETALGLVLLISWQILSNSFLGMDMETESSSFKGLPPFYWVSVFTMRGKKSVIFGFSRLSGKFEE